MKIGSVLVMVLALASCVFGAGAGGGDDVQLTDRSAGQLIYSWRPGSGEMRVRIFRKVCDDGRWHCTDLDAAKEFDHVAKQFKVLPMTENVEPWEISTFMMYGLSVLLEDGGEFAPLASALMLWKADDRSVVLRQFLSAERQILSDVSKMLEKSNGMLGGRARRALLDRVKDELQGDNEIANILSRLAGKGDFYAAVCLYIRFRSKLEKIVEPSPWAQSLVRLVAKWEGDLVSAYNTARAGGTSYEREYKALFPKASGTWSHGGCTSMKDLYECCKSSFMGFEDTRRLSSFCDFEQWGAGMLEVLAMVPGDCDAAQKFGEEFEAALKRYQANKEQFGK